MTRKSIFLKLKTTGWLSVSPKQMILQIWRKRTIEESNMEKSRLFLIAR